MFLAHAFRLRDPWQCEDLADGTRRWTRVFHRPTGLEPDDVLVLVLSSLPPTAQVTVNGHEFHQSERAAGFTPAVPPHSLQPPASSLQPPLPALHYNLTEILNDSNQIAILVFPTDYGLQPTASPAFPYDARLAILARS